MTRRVGGSAATRTGWGRGTAIVRAIRSCRTCLGTGSTRTGGIFPTGRSRFITGRSRFVTATRVFRGDRVTAFFTFAFRAAAGGTWDALAGDGSGGGSDARLGGGLGARLGGGFGAGAVIAGGTAGDDASGRPLVDGCCAIWTCRGR